MHILFNEWIGSKCPRGWVVERFTEYTHLHGKVSPGGYALLLEGNLHLPLTPRLTRFGMSVRFQVNPIASKNCFDLSIVWGYDRRTRQGLAVRLLQSRDQATISLGRQEGNRFQTEQEISQPMLTLTGTSCEVNLDVSAQGVRVSMGSWQAHFGPMAIQPGHLALARGRFGGELLVQHVEIDSPEDPSSEIVLAPVTVSLPGTMHALDVPIRYSVSVSRCDDVYEVQVVLSGGAPEKTYAHPGNYHARLIDWLTQPYVRLVNGSQATANLYLADDTLVLCAPPIPNQFFYNTLYREPAWPLRARFFIEHCPDEPQLVIGYHSYKRNASQARSRGPTEMLVEPESGRVRSWWPALIDKQAELRIVTPASPGLTAKLPRTDPRYDLALAYAANNHYFVKGEACQFTLWAIHDHQLEADEFLAEVQLEDAYFEPVVSWRPLTFEPSSHADIHARSQTTAAFGSDLPVGVYHLRCRLRWGLSSIERVVAMEVMPDSDQDLPAPLASGLPTLLSMTSETRGIESDGFDPWQGVDDDGAHYLSICCYLPDFAVEQRVWDVLRVYGRKWFAYICTRTTNRPSWQDHPEAVAQCDYLFTTDDPTREGLRYYVARPKMYRGYLLEALRRFVSENEIDLDVPPEGSLSRTSFDVLLKNHWHAWLDYFTRDYRQHILEPLRERLHQINPRLLHAGYGPTQTYFGNYHGLHQLRYMGLGDPSNASILWDGFMLMEDYPIAAGYSISRGPYQLASSKMMLRGIHIFPELYADIVQGCPDGAVLYAWPPEGNVASPVATVRKRIFEYAFAAAWFDEGRFNYWQDDGFHTCKWTRERYEVLLRAWREVRLHRPAHPMRGIGFVQSEACCRSHGSRLSDAKNASVFNTTEEAVAWAYEMSREAGLPAGFTLRLESVDQLRAEDVHTLVLPALHALTDAQRTAIRQLHEQGVNLLAFEIVPGLEDLFGVANATTPGTGLTQLRVNDALKDNPLARLGAIVETPDPVDHEMRYIATGAKVLLTGESPVLFLHQTQWGRTALYNLSPTMVRRDVLDGRYTDGAMSLSTLMNRSCQTMFQLLGDQAMVSTSEGKLIVFKDVHGDTVIVVEEDAWPDTPREIHPLVRIRLPGVTVAQLQCDQPMAVIRDQPGDIRLRLKLGEHECALIVVHQ